VYVFVDPHTHHFVSNYSTLELIRDEGFKRVFILAYIPVKPLHLSTLVDLFRWLVEVEPLRFKDLGIELRVGLGIHPRNIPPNLEGFKDLEDWLVRADFIGEVGLELGSDDEVKVFSEMLRLAKEFDKVIIIHTPRRNKELITKKVIKYVVLSGISLDRVVIDHISREVVKEVIDLGTYVGLTVQPGKLSSDDVVNLVRDYPELIDRGLVNSDCGRDPSDPLAVKKTYAVLLNSGLGLSDARKLVSDNALKLIK
jgi:predicted metal-dependent TIM-barrel fold hydrolase